MTGRPFVWLGECAEHSVVSRIEDFHNVRFFVLLVVLVTIVYVGSIISPFVGGQVMGIIAVSLFVFAPGYSFIYLQGMTGIMVLLCVILAAGSFLMFDGWLRISQKKNKDSWIQLAKSIILFIFACMIYPSWAFIVFPIVLLSFGFDWNDPIAKKFEYLSKTLIFYFIVTIAYYLFVRLTLVFYGHISDSSEHTINMQLSPIILIERIKLIINEFYNMRILNFYSPSGGSVIILGLFSLNMGLEIAKKNNEKLG